MNAFDWLREKMKESSFSYTTYDGLMPEEFDVVPLGRTLETINEAEAKWEAEVCEWKCAEWNPKYVINSPHKDCMPLSIADLKNQPYCGHCGKPIKITEVE